eukprot:SAG22_NODE_298_length_12785_cov_5.760129_9_plen_143_part_00
MKTCLLASFRERKALAKAIKAGTPKAQRRNAARTARLVAQADAAAKHKATAAAKQKAAAVRKAAAPSTGQTAGGGDGEGAADGGTGGAHSHTARCRTVGTSQRLLRSERFSSGLRIERGSSGSSSDSDFELNDAVMRATTVQ